MAQAYQGLGSRAGDGQLTLGSPLPHLLSPIGGSACLSHVPRCPSGNAGFQECPRHCSFLHWFVGILRQSCSWRHCAISGRCSCQCQVKRAQLDGFHHPHPAHRKCLSVCMAGRGTNVVSCTMAGGGATHTPQSFLPSRHTSRLRRRRVELARHAISSAPVAEASGGRRPALIPDSGMALGGLARDKQDTDPSPRCAPCGAWALKTSRRSTASSSCLGLCCAAQRCMPRGQC